jgi:hypothetical protein
MKLQYHTHRKKLYIRKSMSFEGQQQNDKISSCCMIFNVMNSTNTIYHLENLRKYVVKNKWKRKTDTNRDNILSHTSMTVWEHVNT